MMMVNDDNDTDYDDDDDDSHDDGDIFDYRNSNQYIPPIKISNFYSYLKEF